MEPDEPRFDPATQSFRKPAVISLDEGPPARPSRTAPTRPRRDQFPPGMQGMREYQAAVQEHDRKQGGGDVGLEQRQALGGR